MLTLLNGSLALLILGLAIWVVVAREAFAAVVGFMAYGLLLALVWVQLQGVDIALTEAAIGAGLTGVLLIAAVTRLRAAEPAVNAVQPSLRLRWLAGGLSLTFTLLLALCVLALPDPAPTLAHAVAANLDVTGVGNPITAVLLAFRSLDTLLEAIVLLLALIGVWSLAPESVWNGRPGLAQQLETNGILAYAARLLVPIGIVAGGYIFWVGADHPGGKFQGATVLAAMWLLVMLAGLQDAPPINRTWLRIGLVGGPLVFIAIGLVGVLSAGAFLGYPLGLAKPLIIAIELALMPSLTIVLGLLLVGTPQRKVCP